MHSLYLIIIYPIVQIIETVYVLIYKIFGNQALSILGVSFAVTFLCLPLYAIAEKWQKTERETIKKMQPQVDTIKASFKGDEQYMILSTYYRQNHYHPVYALRNSFGILIQIPFFIAAYTYLSHMESLRGISFLFIRDFSAPDALWNIGSFSINILPILMTLINCISGAIYTQKLSPRDKIQVYGMAAVFLVLLYNSPSALVLYWTMNNIFSLIKNIFYKLKNPLKILYFIICFAAFAFIIYLSFINTGDLKKRLVLICAFSLIFFIPLFIKAVLFIQNKFLNSLSAFTKQRMALFIISCLMLSLITGLFIPASVIASSPEEFSFIDHYKSPFPFIYNSFFGTLGLFTFWPVCIYFLFGDRIKTLLTAFFSIFSLFALINTVIFQGNLGGISNTFVLLNISGLAAPLGTVVLNTAILALVMAGFFIVSQINRIKFISSITGIFLISLTLFSAYNMIHIRQSYKLLAMRHEQDIHEIKPVFSLSRDKPNVIVFMADCAINGFVKPIFEEHPFLKQKFDGFILYPNTVSFGLHTVIGAPPIWGGYEYTPREMNKRDTVPMVEKHNEALLVLPRLLDSAGYKVTVTDPSWANYAWIPDTCIYDSYKNITALNLARRYSSIWYTKNNFGNGEITGEKIKRNIMWFSFLKIAPPLLRTVLYDDGLYWSTGDIGYSMDEFIDSYAILDFLPELTTYDSEEPSSLLISNETTHESAYLQYPDYIPMETVTDFGPGEYAKIPNYHTSNALYLRFGEWLDELKKNGVYDNTRIILVSDHGAAVNAKLPGKNIPIPGERRESYNPLLLVKDFYAHGELETDPGFMTNGDVPLLAIKGIIDSPINPFTNKPMTSDDKKEGAYITINHVSMAYQHNKYTYKIKNDQWIYVHDNIFDAENWSKIK